MSLETPQALVKELIDAGYSQTVIGDRAGVKQPTISRILSGEHTDTKSSVLIKLKEFADEVRNQQETSPEIPGHARRATDKGAAS
jgi:predicted transcriptional regulator